MPLSDSNKTNNNDETLVSDVINSGNSVNGTVTVGTTAVEAKVGASTLTDRKLLIVNNSSNITIYWGFTNSVTTANGIPLTKDQEAVWDIGEAQKVYLIAATAGNVVRVAEGS